MDVTLLYETLLRGIIAYVVLIAYVRVSGARTLAKMHAFDFVVTISLGSLLAATVLSQGTPLWQGLVAMALLVALQWTVARLSHASGRFNKVVGNASIRLFADGRFDEDALRRARVTRDEVESAARMAGHGDLSRVRAVWLETSGSLSVVDKD